MNKLTLLLQRATAKAQSCSEAKHLAAFIEDILDDHGDDPRLVAESMRVMVNWAIDFMRAADATTPT